MNKIIQKSTKKQHYVPQFYLRQWTDSTRGFYPIKILNKKPPQLKIFDRKSGPASFCFENYFYAQHTGKEDEISQTLEKYFAEIEAIFASKLPELEQKILNGEQITSDDKYHLCECMLFLHFRGKKYRQQSQEMSESMIKQVNKHLAYYSDKSPKTKLKMEELGLTKKDMIEFAEKGEYTVDFGNMHHLEIMKDMEGFCNMLHAKYWKVYITRNSDFITTDTPYQDLPTSDKFWGNDFLSREQRFVLSPRVVIVALYPKDQNSKNFHRKDITGNNGSIHIINSDILMNSISFGFHKDKNVLEVLDKVVHFRHSEHQKNRQPESYRN